MLINNLVARFMRACVRPRQLESARPVIHSPRSSAFLSAHMKRSDGTSLALPNKVKRPKHIILCMHRHS